MFYRIERKKKRKEGKKYQKELKFSFKDFLKNVNHLKSIYYICYNIASVVYVLVFLTLRQVAGGGVEGSQLPDQQSDPHPLLWKVKFNFTGPPGKSWKDLNYHHSGLWIWMVIKIL